MHALVFTLGIACVGLVVVRLGVFTVSSIQRTIHEKEQQRLSLKLMQAQLAAIQKNREAGAVAWNGFRKFVIQEKIDEAQGVCSFVLQPHDGKPLPPYQPGQYLTFRLDIPGQKKPVVRCYSLSDCHAPECYRITIKRVLSPRDMPAVLPGLVSNYFHEQLDQGDILDVQAPRGQFVLDPDKDRPAVLIAGGVGVTPLLSMVNTIARQNSGREVLFFYGIRNSGEHAFKKHLEELVENHANIRLVVAYSSPTEQDEKDEGRGFHHRGWVNLELLKGYLSSTNYEFYICGPPPMMETLTKGLAKWGVAKKDIHTEAFGPVTVSAAFAKPKSASIKATTEEKTASCQVTFAKSKVDYKWTATSENLLDFAQANGVTIKSGCRAGSCGTCVLAIKSGRVTYLTEHGVELEEGTCLTCIAAPDGDLVLDA